MITHGDAIMLGERVSAQWGRYVSHQVSQLRFIWVESV